MIALLYSYCLFVYIFSGKTVGEGVLREAEEENASPPESGRECFFARVGIQGEDKNNSLGTIGVAVAVPFLCAVKVPPMPMPPTPPPRACW